MFDTNIVIVGNVLTTPEWRKTSNSGHLVTNFRIASTSRRLDRETGRWIDGNSLRVRVVCWRKLAEGIAASLTVGDPVVVTGKLYTRDWIDGDNNPRTSYEMEAVAVGHDLARGRGRFYRNRANATSVVESDGEVRGETADLVSEEEVPIAYGDGVPDGPVPTFEEPPAGDSSTTEVVAEPDPMDELKLDELEIAVEAVAEERSPRPRRPSRRQPVPA